MWEPDTRSSQCNVLIEYFVRGLNEKGFTGNLVQKPRNGLAQEVFGLHIQRRINGRILVMLRAR